MGKVASAQMMIVLPIELQKSVSVSRYLYCDSPAYSIEPRPSQRWNDRYSEKPTGIRPKARKSR